MCNIEWGLKDVLSYSVNIIKMSHFLEVRNNLLNVLLMVRMEIVELNAKITRHNLARR